jgi:hypothetical protein
VVPESEVVISVITFQYLSIEKRVASHSRQKFGALSLVFCYVLRKLDKVFLINLHPDFGRDFSKLEHSSSQKGAFSLN